MLQMIASKPIDLLFMQIKNNSHDVFDTAVNEAKGGGGKAHSQTLWSEVEGGGEEACLPPFLPPG